MKRLELWLIRLSLRILDSVYIRLLNRHVKCRDKLNSIRNWKQMDLYNKNHFFKSSWIPAKEKWENAIAAFYRD